LDASGVCDDRRVRAGATVKTLLVLAVASRVDHHLHGSPIDYVGLAAAAAASWVGVPGPGEPVLIAAAVFAARGRLDITEVVVVAWAAATLGGIAGWLIGRHIGRTVATAPGPLRRARLAAVARGDEVFARYAVIAILLTPSWVAGILRVNTGVYLIWNAIGAAFWAVGIGLAAYFIGPSVIEFVQDYGVITSGIVVVVIVVGIVVELRRRRRSRGRSRSSSPTGTAPTNRH
jgi:membrane protein DedA with SNARE-associated domain